MSVFSSQARGPSAAKYADQLAQDCADYWRSGRQMCEELSLTGNRCQNRRHHVPGQEKKKNDVDKRCA